MNLKKEGEVQPAIGVKCQVLRAFSQVNYEVKKTIEYKKTVRPRLHGTGRIWDRSEIRPFSPVYTRIRPVRGSQIRPVLWPKRTNFRPVPYSSGIPCSKRGLSKSKRIKIRVLQQIVNFSKFHLKVYHAQSCYISWMFFWKPYLPLCIIYLISYFMLRPSCIIH